MRRSIVPREWEKQELEIRFGSITHRASVYCNGSLTANHEGGFLPCGCQSDGSCEIW